MSRRDKYFLALFWIGAVGFCCSGLLVLFDNILRLWRAYR